MTLGGASSLILKKMTRARRHTLKFVGHMTGIKRQVGKEINRRKNHKKRHMLFSKCLYNRVRDIKNQIQYP